MKILHYILLWLVGIASGDKILNACRNNASGDEGICSSEWLCFVLGGLNIETCTSSIAKNICCKILFGNHNEVNKASSVVPSNIFSSYEERKANSNFTSRKLVLDACQDPQSIVDKDLTGNQLRVLQRNCSREYSQKVSTNKYHHNVDQNYSSVNFQLSLKLHPKLNLRNYVPLQVKKYILKNVKKDPSFSPQKSNKEDLPYNQKLHESNPEDDFEKLVNGKEARVSKSSIKQKNHDLRSPVQLHVTNYFLKPVQTDSTFYLQKPVQIYSSNNFQKQILFVLKSIHHKIVKGITTRDLELAIMQDHDIRNPAHIQPTNDLRKPAQTDNTFYLQKPVQVDPSHDLRNVVKVSDSHDLRWPEIEESDHNLQNPVQVHSANDLRKPVQTDSTFYLQKPVQVDPSHDLRKLVKVSDSHDLRWPVIEESEHNLQNPVQVHATNDLRKPVQTDSTFYLRKPVQTDSSFYIRKPVQTDSSFYIRKPVQTDSSFYLRKPVQTDSTFYLQKPVQVDSSHDLRKAVKVADSHDLRWPVVQEPDHDLRNPDADTDFFRSENVERNLDKIIETYAKKKPETGKNNSNHDPVYELLYEDSHIKSNCNHKFWSRNNNTSDNRTHLESQDIEVSKQKVLFRNSTRTCGIPYNESTENPNFQRSNSNLGPWMVSVQEYFFGKFRHKCGGSLLNNLWIITAAHCVDLRPKWDFLLKLGTDSNGESQNKIERSVSKISVHPRYNNMKFDNDIALIRMEIPVDFQSNIVPICLPDIHDKMEKRKAVVFGWKVATRRKMSSGEAQAETVPVLTNKECEVMFSETGVNESIEKNFVCAGARSVKESCTGDSGGPLAVLDTRGRWSLAGLYSWGKTCKIPNQPEVYISVTSYVNWIEDTITCFEHYINLGRVSS